MFENHYLKDKRVFSRWIVSFSAPILSYLLTKLSFLRHAKWPLAFAIGFGLFSLCGYGVVQAMPDHFDLPLFGRVSANVVWVPVGATFIAFFALLPFWFPETDELNVPKRFELAAILGGSVVAIAGAIFLIGEYQDQKQARVTRAWDLLHKATERARDRMDAAEREIDAKISDSKEEAKGCLPLLEVDCEKIKAYVATLVERRDNSVRIARQDATRGNDGQLGALRALNEAGVNLDNIKLDEIDLTQVELPKAKLVLANLRRAQLASANLRNANLWDANLNEAHLPDANLREAKLEFANLNKAWLIDANLSGAILHSAELIEAVINNADFSGADLRWAKLRGAKLRGANFSGADLSNASFIDAEQLALIRGGVPEVLFREEFFSKSILCRTRMRDGSNCNRDCDGDDKSCPYFPNLNK